MDVDRVRKVCLGMVSAQKHNFSGQQEALHQIHKVFEGLRILITGIAVSKG